MQTFDITTFQELEIATKHIASLLKPGDILALQGNLGTGKTTFTKLLGRILGIHDDITSPTFTIIQEYRWKERKLYHLDLYRIKDEKELDTLQVLELLHTHDDLMIIEWPEIVENWLPKHTKKLEFLLENNQRTLKLNEPESTTDTNKKTTPTDSVRKPIKDDWCLRIDTTNNKKLYLSVNQFEKTIQYDSPREQDTLKAIESFLNEHHLALQQLRSIEVAQGPGSFTSLRTGIATAQALAMALDIPINNQQPGSSVEAQYGAPPSITQPKRKY